MYPLGPISVEWKAPGFSRGAQERESGKEVGVTYVKWRDLPNLFLSRRHKCKFSQPFHAYQSEAVCSQDKPIFTTLTLLYLKSVDGFSHEH